MAIQLYNTLTRRREAFSPERDNTVRMYNCGPTVYSAPHIGNMRAYIFADLLRRTLELEGWQVEQVINITDVGHLTSQADTGEDKVESAARKSGKSAWEIARQYEKAFLADCKALHIKKAAYLPRATEHIAEQIELVQRLVEGGYTYKIDDGIYFDTDRFPRYGALTGQKLTEKRAGARVKVARGKKHPADFALWKFSNPHEQRQMEWESPWGKGFPGWHVECSAMSRKYLGQPFDIHTGGVDHIPIHHANEIAQSEAAYGVPLARFWLHCEFLVRKEKMSKSLGNIITLNDLTRQGYHPLAFRLLALSAHYRSILSFSLEALTESQKNLFAFHALKKRFTQYKKTIPPKKTLTPDSAIAEVKKLHRKFRNALRNDLDTPTALAAMFTFMRRLNALMDTGTLDQKTAKLADKFWADIEAVLAITDTALLAPVIPPEIKKLVEKRSGLRRDKNFTAADKIRDDVARKGFALEDTPQGTNIHPLPRITP